MKVIKHNLPDFETLHILPLADPHIGDIHSDFKKLQQELDVIKNSENTYTILNGDLVDMAVRSSIGDIYGQNLTPMKALEQCAKIFGPIAGKILAVNPGNHELRVWRTDGIDVTQMLCHELGIAGLYSNASTLLFVRFGALGGHCHDRKACYTVYVTHGAGGGRTEGAKVKRLADLAAIVDADVYIHSHTHLPVIFKEKFYRVSAPNSSVQAVDKLFVNTGSTLEYGGYGELQSYKPNSMDTPIIHLSGTERRLSATL